MEEKRGLLDWSCCAYPPSIFEYHVHWRYSVGHTISQSLPSRKEAYKWFRIRFYEFFKETHFLAVGFFIVLFFIHCDFRLTAWYIRSKQHHNNANQNFRDYFIAALSLYCATYIFAFFRTAIQSLKAEGKFTLLPDSIIRILILSKMSWKPGQHVFLRFWALPGLHSYSMHPFTICSLPSSGEMVFFVRPHRGFTAV
jgi:hypothetical protein